jgi:predicted metallo-beta-lactamase superfamily hydrolase
MRDPRFTDRFARLWATGRVVTAAGYLGVADAPLESRRHRAWTAARKPPAQVREPRAKILGSKPRKFAKGGFTE